MNAQLTGTVVTTTGVHVVCRGGSLGRVTIDPMVTIIAFGSKDDIGSTETMDENFKI